MVDMSMIKCDYFLKIALVFEKHTGKMSNNNDING